MTGEVTTTQESIQVRYQHHLNGETRRGTNYLYGDPETALRRARLFIASQELESWEIVRIRKTEEVVEAGNG